MTRFIFAVLLAFACPSSNASAQSNFCSEVEGAIVINADDEYIGIVTNSYHPNSIFNEYGRYGSPYQTASIWNQYGKNGSEYQANSAFNPYAADPPRLIKNRRVIGYLSVNRNLRGAINPIVLGASCYDFQPPR